MGGRVSAIQRPLFKIGLLVMLGLAVFWRVGTLDFLFVDDVRYIHGNPNFATLNAENLGKLWTESYLNLYVPIPLSIWAVEMAMARHTDERGRVSLDAAVFHFTNLVIHLAASVMVFLILGLFFENPWAPFFGAAIFAVHPVQAESVLWVSGLRDVLSGLFSLLAVYFFLRFDAFAVWTGSKKKGWWNRSLARAEGFWHQPMFFYWTSVICFLFAMLSKATVMPLPFILGLLVVLRKPFVWRRLLGILSPYLAIALIFSVIASILQSGERLSHVPPPVWTQPLIALDSAFHYLSRIFYPWPLIFDNGHVPSKALASGWLVVRVAIPVVAGAALIWHARRSGFRWVLIGFLVVLLGIAPVSGIKPFIFQFISSVADRYFYLSMFGVSLAVAAILDRFAYPGAMSLAGVAVLACAVVTARHVPNWKDTMTLFEHNVRHYPQSWYSYNLLGQRARDMGNLQKAYEYFKAGADLNVNAEPVTNLGALFLKVKQYPAAVAAFRQAVALKPDDAATHQNLGVAYNQAGMPNEARAEFETTLKLDPTSEVARQALASASPSGGGK